MTVYSNLYSHLAAKYKDKGMDNFEQIAGAMETYFSDLIHLDVLNEATDKKQKGSYVAFFEQCMDELMAFAAKEPEERLYTEPQVVKALHDILQTPKIKKQFEEQFLFIPKGASSATKRQLGYFEKLATGTLETPEPLSFIDMRRAVNGIMFHMKAKHDQRNIEVLNLHTLSQLDVRAIKAKSQTLIVNLNVDLKGTPKWGVVDLTQAHRPTVYCETALTEDEKKELEKTLAIRPEYLGAKATGVTSTGYTALAWLDNNVTHASTFDVNADFPELLNQCLFIQCVSDNQVTTIQYKFNRQEFQACTDSFKAIIGIRGNLTADHVSPGWIVDKLSSLTALGMIQKKQINGGDLQEVIKIGYEKGWRTHDDFWDEVQKIAHSHPVGFEITLSALRDPQVITEDQDKHIKLTVPPNLDALIGKIRQVHAAACAPTGTSPHWLDSGTPKRDRQDRAYAAKMVMTLIRCKAKKRILEIDLPAEYQLTADEQQLIVASLLNNAYVTDLKINNNQSLINIKSQLIPTLARNRWLENKGYLPPMADNFWRQAAKSWLTHLNEHPEILKDKQEHDFFKNCVSEMGIEGLDAVLALLNDDRERERLERIFGKNKLPFYAACPPDKVEKYLDTLKKYLQANSYFPFSELGFAYQPGNDQAFVDIIATLSKPDKNQLAKLDKFEKITFTDCLKNAFAFTAFLTRLTHEARKNNFVGLIVIPELEQKDNVSEVHRALRSQYALLNNVILENRQKLAAEDVLKGISENSKWGGPLKNPIVAPPAAPPGSGKDVKDPDRGDQPPLPQVMNIEQVMSKLEGKSWPIRKGGDVQLQLQQQQEIQQSRQVQKEQERMVLNVVTEAISSTLVNYGNIEELLGEYYKTLNKENPVNIKAASLKKARGETDLQGFFHTWVNADPDKAKDAPQIISQMTLDAAKALLRYRQRLPSGLNPDNLPKGFFTQRSKDGKLVLSYNPEKGYVNAPNALTPILAIKKPDAESWEGDFRQFDLDAYAEKPDLKNTHEILLFAMLQPAKKDYSSDWDSFLKINGANPAINNLRQPAIEKIKKNWVVFIQAWQYAGTEGIQWFLLKDQFTPPVPEACALLLGELDRKLIKLGQKIVGSDANALRALGQVFYRYRNEGLTLFLRKLQQIETQLGPEFLKHFSDHVLKASENYNCFMSVPFFQAVDGMIEKFQEKTAKDTTMKVWKTIIEHHMQGVGWENIETLWTAFDNFANQVEKDMGLKLTGNEFKNVPAGNMLVVMDRVLASLRNIPEQSAQIEFLAHLDDLDLTEGGVSYALQHEGFKFVDPALKLKGFEQGTPTYAPNLKDLYRWPVAHTTLNTQRALAAKSQFNREDYKRLVDSRPPISPDVLILLLHTQYQNPGVVALLQQINTLGNDSFRSIIAKHLHNAIYRLGNEELSITLDGLSALADRRLSQAALGDLLNRYPNGTFLESMSILAQAKRVAQADGVIGLFQQPIATPLSYSPFLLNTGYKLATLFGRYEARFLEEFIAATTNIEPVIDNELRHLAKHLLSIDYSSNLSPLTEKKSWEALLACITNMRKDLANPAEYRHKFIQSLVNQGVKFKISKAGDFRALTDKERPNDVNFFPDHKEPLWSFLKEHIVIPSPSQANEALSPILRFLKKLQQNRTYLNEVEPLLATLNKTKAGEYWTATYFYQLIMTLQSEDGKSAFPITLLKTILNEDAIKAKGLDEVKKDLPKTIVTSLKKILKNEAFGREQQAILAQIMLREYHWQENVETFNEIMHTLSAHVASSKFALNILSKSKSHAELKTNYDNCKWLLENNDFPPEIAGSLRSQTSDYWLQALSSQKPNVAALFTTIKGFGKDKQALILHIVAFSALRVGLRDTESYEYELEKKAPKLAERLAKMSVADLKLIAQCFPQEPAPGVDELLRIIKQGSATLKQNIDAFSRKPFPEARSDFGKVVSTRDADLQRMIAETRVTAANGTKASLPQDKVIELTLIFNYIKQLEAGIAKIEVGDTQKAISEMSREELHDAFQRLSNFEKLNPDNAKTKAQISAILFEGMARTTRKYPHLAQQFALIANDIGVKAPTRVLQLATGEGKSHFVAFRAVRHAGLGKQVDISTAKRTLSERDREDYAPLLDYFGIRHAYIHPKSSLKDYTDAQVHYSTIGDLSLFLDHQSYTDKPVAIPPENRVALFDEFDFMCFDEGRKTEYNYARPTDKTPKEMTWFYQEINAFYKANAKALEQAITVPHIAALAAHLIKTAGANEDRYRFVSGLLRDPIVLVQWLQAAYQAHTLKFDEQFTVREEIIQVGTETYPMREIIPLSSDNQKMIGSTFSGGVHQLLAVHLNSLAMEQNKPQNHHILPESNIISSQVAAQRMKELWSNWEGFTGTVSTAQAKTLGDEYQTQVLHVPTNQRTLRQWHKPTFYADKGKGVADKDPRWEAVAQQVKSCIAKKQSMLFSCKNDKQVNELKVELKKYLTAAEQEHLMFYTNEEHQTASEVLADKRKKENWVGGRKQNAIGLVASGFGRGDNVEVEVVFLFDVNDNNDKLQKGGRTARNGAEGAVFQFYRSNDIRAELVSLMTGIKPEDRARITAELAKITAAGDEGTFEKVMLLREYNFTLENAANQGYHALLAQYSNWGMSCLGQITDPLIRPQLSNYFANQMKQLDKEWVEWSSKKDLSIQQKVTAIGEVIKKESTRFAELYRADAQKEAPKFDLVIRPLKEIPLMVEPAHTKPTKLQKTISSICSVLSRLPGIDLSPEEMKEIIGKLDILARYPKDLTTFANEAAQHKSKAVFMQALTLKVLQAQPNTQAQNWTTAVNVASFKINIAILSKVTEEIKLNFKKLMDKLHPDLQKEVMDYLGEHTLQETQSQIILMTPILQYLGTFTLDQQLEWGGAYTDQLRDLTLNMKPELLKARLHTAFPMHIDHFNGLWGVTQGIGVKDNEVGTLLDLMVKAVKPSPEQRVRQLTQWESLNKTALTPAKQKLFLEDFCTFMDACEEGKNWDIFARFVENTKKWWNKGGFLEQGAKKNEYSDGIITLLSSIVRRKDDLVALEPLLRWGLKLGGKAWYEILEIALKHPAAILNTYPDQLAKIWPVIDGDNALKKSAKNKRFDQALVQLKILDDIRNRLPTTAVKGTFLSTFQKLDGRQLIHIITLTEQYQTLTIGDFNAIFTQLMTLSAAHLDLINPVLNVCQEVLLRNPKTFLELAKLNEKELKQVHNLATVHKAMLVTYQPVLLEHPNILIGLLKLTADHQNYLSQLANVCQEVLMRHPNTFLELTKLGDKELKQVHNLATVHKAMLVTYQPVLLEHPNILIGLLKLTADHQNYLSQLANVCQEVLMKHPNTFLELTKLGDKELKQVSNLATVHKEMLDNYKAVLLQHPEILLALVKLTVEQQKLVALLAKTHKEYLLQHPDALFKLTTLTEMLLKWVSSNLAKEHQLYLLQNPDTFVQLSTLKQDHLDWISKLDKNHQLLLLEQPELLPHLVKLTKDQLEEIAKLNQAHQLLLLKHPDILKQFNALTEDQLEWASDLAHKNRDLVTTYPEVFEYMIRIATENIQPDFKESLMRALVLTAQAHKDGKVNLTIAALIGRVDAFKDGSQEQLDLLVRLLTDYPQYTGHVLFDNTLTYLLEVPYGRLQNRVIEVIHQFYSHADNARGDVDVIHNKGIKPLFNEALSNKESADVKNQRVILMHLLKQGAFISTYGNGRYELSEEENERLIDLAFKNYQDKTKGILATPAQEPKRTRDLTHGQQSSLLQLSEELRLLGRGATREAAESLQSLGKNLKTLVGTYEASWFKSKERIEQASRLSAQMDTLRDKGGYLAVIEALHKARTEAFESDTKLNETRWIKINSSGQSRWRNTLNQAIDMVIKHWTQDIENLHDFQRIQGFLNTEFKDLTSQLSQTVKVSVGENAASRFVREKERNAVNTLDKLSSAFQTEINRPDVNVMDKGAALEKFLTEITLLEPALPGHLVTLVNELKVRGQSMAKFNDMRNDFGDSQAITRS